MDASTGVDGLYRIKAKAYLPQSPDGDSSLVRGSQGCIEMFMLRDMKTEKTKPFWALDAPIAWHNQ